MSVVTVIALTIVLFLAFLLFVGIVARAIRGKKLPGPPLTTTDSGSYEVAGRPVTCNHCGGGRFTEQETLLNTWLLSLVTLDWLDPSVTALICNDCGQITFFAQKPDGDVRNETSRR